MTYTSKQICSIPFYDYVNLMVIELNENGFKVTVLEETDNYTFGWLMFQVQLMRLFCALVKGGS